MARLISSDSGTVVRCEGDLAAHYLRLGWVDADAIKQVEATPVKPQSKRVTPRKSVK